MADAFVVVATTAGRLEAEILKSYLNSYGVKAELSQEAAAWVEGLTVGPMAEVEILVPSHQAKEARQALEAYRRAV